MVIFLCSKIYAISLCQSRMSTLTFWELTFFFSISILEIDINIYELTFRHFVKKSIKVDILESWSKVDIFWKLTFLKVDIFESWHFLKVDMFKTWHFSKVDIFICDLNMSSKKSNKWKFQKCSAYISKFSTF